MTWCAIPGNRANSGSAVLRWGVRSIAAAMPLAVAMGCAAAASAAPSQPGITTAPAQPGSTVPARLPRYRLPAQPAPDEPAAPATDYGRSRPVPPPRYAAPVQPQQLHLPQPVPKVAPIVPWPNTIRVGGFTTVAPSFLPKTVVNQINTAAAGAEAQIDTFSRSVGVQPSRSDRIAAATVGGAVVGTIGAGLTGAVVAGAVGAGIGAAVGGGIGAAVALAPGGVGIPVLPQLVGTGAALGAVVGALVTAPIVAVPAAVAGGVTGGLIGAYVGSATL